MTRILILPLPAPVVPRVSTQQPAPHLALTAQLGMLTRTAMRRRHVMHVMWASTLQQGLHRASIVQLARTMATQMRPLRVLTAMRATTLELG